MSAVLARSTYQGGQLAGYLFWCPGCKDVHPVTTSPPPAEHGGPRPVWGFDGNELAPTFTPSLLVYGDKAHGGKRPRCHSFIRAGHIEFLGDSEHELAGKTVPLPPWRGWDNDEAPTEVTT